MVRTALLALMVIALDVAWWLMPQPGAAAAWPRVASRPGCTLTLHEPRRDPATDGSAAHTLRIAFSCVPTDGGGGQRALRGTAVVLGDPLVDGGAYAMSGARVGLIAFPTVLDPDSADARECRIAIESLLSGTALRDGDPRLRPSASSEVMLAGPDSRVYALRGGAWWREEIDGAWTRLAERGSPAARRDPRLVPLERAMADRQPRDGR